MTRVGFVLGQVGWMGAVNYYRNLFMAIQKSPETGIRPVVLAGFKSDVTAYEGLAEVIRSSMFDRASLSWLLSQFLARVLPGRDYLLYWFLRRHRIDMLSHSGRLWRGCSIPTLGWIPDFQHLRLVGFFDGKESAVRNAAFPNIIRRSEALVLSSQDALHDLKTYFPDIAIPAYVLNFVSCLQSSSNGSPSRIELMTRYKLDRPWFYIPNQFWAHKNHGVVVQALRQLKADGKRPLVVATGLTSDSRNSRYFPALMESVADYGLDDDFRVLGVVPYDEVVALMKYSTAVINPSLFEGWSTSVEESKSMGKSVILSSIAVHLEQRPQRAHYFDANDPHALAREMNAVLTQYDEVEDRKQQKIAAIEQSERTAAFAGQYAKIVSQIMGRRR